MQVAAAVAVALPPGRLMEDLLFLHFVPFDSLPSLTSFRCIFKVFQVVSQLIRTF